MVCCNGNVKFIDYDHFSIKLDDAAKEKEKELRQKRVRFSEILIATSAYQIPKFHVLILFLVD